jgi:hypothetical protein
VSSAASGRYLPGTVADPVAAYDADEEGVLTSLPLPQSRIECKVSVRVDASPVARQTCTVLDHTEKQDSGITGTGKKLVRCDVCGSSVQCSPEDLLRYIKTGWPRCCGSVTTFHAWAERAGPDDTKQDTPPVPPGHPSSSSGRTFQQRSRVAGTPLALTPPVQAPPSPVRVRSRVVPTG